MVEQKTKLIAEDISEGSSVNQAGGNINIISNKQGLQLTDVIPLVESLVKPELEICKLQAEQIVRNRLNDFSKDLETELERKVSDKISRFSEPSIQYATRQAALGFIKSGDIETKETLIDLLIDRVKVNERTSKQFLIDEAINILPKLSKENLATLTLLTHRQLFLKNGSNQKLELWIKCLNPILDYIPNVSKLDLAYLIQADCVSPMNGFRRKDWFDENRTNYPLYFCSPVNLEKSTEFKKKYKIESEEKRITFAAPYYNQEFAFLMVTIFDFNDDGTINPKLTTKEAYADTLKRNNFSSIETDIKNMLDSVRPMNNSEIEAYYTNLHSNWPLAIKLLQEPPLAEYVLKPVGAYIGSKQISKLYGEEIDVNLFYQ